MSVEINSDEYGRNGTEVDYGVEFEPEPEFVAGCEEPDAEVDKEAYVDGSLAVKKFLLSVVHTALDPTRITRKSSFS